MASQCKLLDLSPACLNIKGVRAGDKNLRVFKLTANGSPRDLTGSTIKAQARKDYRTDVVSLTADIVITDAVNGTFTLAWPGDDVATLLTTSDTWSGVWDVEILEPGETEPVTIAAGTISCVMGVTR